MTPISSNIPSLNARGVWFSAEVLGGVSCHLREPQHGALPVPELHRRLPFSQYLKVGVGIGPNTTSTRGLSVAPTSSGACRCLQQSQSNLIWPLPHGGACGGIEAGASIRDGAFSAHTRHAYRRARNAFTIGISYMGQGRKPPIIPGWKTCKYTSLPVSPSDIILRISLSEYL